LLNKEKTNLPHAILDLIDKICQENKLPTNEYSYEKSDGNKFDTSLLEKLYYLSEYKHEQCGYIFRNSMKYSHLHYDVLRLKKEHPRQKRSIDLAKEHSRSHNKYFSQNSPGANEITNSTSKKYVTRLEKRYSAKKYTTLINLKPKYSAATYKMKHKIINLTTSVISLDSTSKSTFINTTKENLVETDSSSDLNKPLPETSTIINQNLPSIRYTLSNCSLILLNTYLLAFKSNCDYADFTETLASFDCVTYKFSAVSNCTQCKVSTCLIVNRFIN